MARAAAATAGDAQRGRARAPGTATARAQPVVACRASWPSLSWRARRITATSAARRFAGYGPPVSGGWAGVRWGSTPDAGRSSRRRRRAAPVAVAGWLAAAAARVWLLVDPRTPDLAAQVYRRRAVPSRSGSRCGTSTGTPATTCPATACCSRRWRRCSGCARWRRCRVLASVALFDACCAGASCCGRRGARVAARLLFAVAAVGDVWIGRLAFALGVSLALGARARADAAGARSWRRCWRRCARRRAPWRACCWRWPALTYALAQALAAGAARARGAGVRRSCWRCGCCSPKAATSRFRCCRSSRRRSSSWRSCARCRAVQTRLLRIGAVVYLLACLVVPADPHADGQQRRALRRAAGRAAAAVRAGRRAAGRAGRVARGGAAALA